MLYSLVFAREMTLDETEVRTHLKKSGLRGGAARQPVATTAQEAPLNWARRQTFGSGSVCLMTTLHRGHALLHLTRKMRRYTEHAFDEHELGTMMHLVLFCT
jgi:hypothetical protein